MSGAGQMIANFRQIVLDILLKFPITCQLALEGHRLIFKTVP